MLILTHHTTNWKSCKWQKKSTSNLRTHKQ